MILISGSEKYYDLRRRSTFRDMQLIWLTLCENKIQKTFRDPIMWFGLSQLTHFNIERLIHFPIAPLI